MLKRTTNLEQYKNVLPYASEIFGVYQPLLGWKSKRIESRFLDSFKKDRQQSIEALAQNFKGNFKVGFDGEYISIEYISPGLYGTSDSVYESTIVKIISEKLPKGNKYQDKIWDEFISYDALNSLLMNEVSEVCKTAYSRLYSQDLQLEDSESKLARQIITEKINRESVISGVILYLKEHKYFNYLKQIFYDPNKNLTLDFLLNIRNYNDPFDSIDPKKDLDRVGLSPVGIVHLFRQYFFEFDTFLGTPVGHIWLSPGASVELVEISTRKTITERLVESSLESIVKSEKSLTEEDEISEAVKQDNQTNTKFGASVNANQSWIWGSASQTASFDLDTTQKTAREETHKHMRQQTEKLSSEIKKNFKTTFKTITEVIDTSSKRYVLQNNTPELINYELRRKMRQVGVQVQDIGTYLCWQTYVDDPGKQLGVANLVNIASPSDLQNIQAPELIPEPEPLIKGTPITQNYIWFFRERKTFFVPINEIQIVPPKYGYIYDRAEFALMSGDRWDFQIREGESEEIDTGAGNGTKEKSVKSIIVGIQPGSDGLETNERPQFSYQVTVLYKPSQKLVNDIKVGNNSKIQNATAEKVRLFRESYIKAAKDRIKLASNIQSRKYEELREEERIVVYRRLIQELLTKGIAFPNDNTRHIVSELINSIFDVEKMLYFVAPEWWRPRLHQSRQTFGSLVPDINPDGTLKIDSVSKQPILVPNPNTNISPENVVSWGGINENREDNYYITEDSAPAKLGSSLGWLLQLDGDNLRNAFLNAPWVKAVIPIRPGKEKAAINWLKQVEGMNGIGASDMYTGNESGLQGKTMLEALEILAKKVAEKHKKSNDVMDIPDPDNPTDTDNTVSATPVDKVYEHGFYPLQEGFRVNVGKQFEVFDQWVEILPTDQVVAVEVKYDPKTGRQV